MVQGQVDAGAWSCGMAAGLIRDIPSVGDLVRRIMDEARTLVRERLGRQFLTAGDIPCRA